MNARPVFPHRPRLLQPFQLPHPHLELQPEHLVVHFRQLALQLGIVQTPQFIRFHKPACASSRLMNLVLIGSLCAASRIADSAVPRSTPSISNSTFPGRITATHCSGAPLPFPMRVSAGFLVIGLSGNSRIHTLPPRLIERVIATRAASICRSVIHAHSIAFKPYSPYEISEPRHALPAIRPRCCFLYFTFLGIIMAVYLLTGSRRNPRAVSAACSPPPASPRALRAGLPASTTAVAAPSKAAESAPWDARPDAAAPTAALVLPDHSLAAPAR